MQVTDGMFLNSSKLGDVKEWKKSVIKDLREITSVVKSSESMRGVKQYAAIATGYVNILKMAFTTFLPTTKKYGSTANC